MYTHSLNIYTNIENILFETLNQISNANNVLVWEDKARQLYDLNTQNIMEQTQNLLHEIGRIKHFHAQTLDYKQLLPALWKETKMQPKKYIPITSDNEPNTSVIVQGMSPAYLENIYLSHIYVSDLKKH